MSKILLILGSGQGLGAATARKFIAAGYKVATASRHANPSNDTDDLINVKADFSNPTSVKQVVDHVVEKLGVPSVLVYNAYTHIPDRRGPFASNLSLEDFTAGTNVEITSFFAAASLAQSLNPKITILYTGNACNTQITPSLSLLGVGKTAAAHLIQQAVVAEKAAQGQAKFYYLDQRDPKGEPMWNGVDPEPHADKFLELVNREEQGEPLVIFRS